MAERKKRSDSKHAAVLKLTLAGVAVKEAAERAGVSLSYAYLVRSRAREVGLEVPYVPGNRGGGRKYKAREEGNEKWRALGDD